MSKEQPLDDQRKVLRGCLERMCDRVSEADATILRHVVASLSHPAHKASEGTAPQVPRELREAARAGAEALQLEADCTIGDNYKQKAGAKRIHAQLLERFAETTNTKER